MHMEANVQGKITVQNHTAPRHMAGKEEETRFESHKPKVLLTTPLPEWKTD